MQLKIPLPRTIFSVSQINRTIARTIQQTPQLSSVWVKGQVSNLGHPGSGHIYFSLKDESSTLNSVMFRSNASKLKFQLQDGEEILVQGKIDIYAPGSQYQIIVNTIEPLGIGALQRAFEDLKQKLSEEGLFDKAYKKPLPIFPKKIGVITSATGAAIKDIQQQIQNRYPIAELLLYPTLVQGDNAAPQIAKAIYAMNKRHDIDVLIVGRGGGSIEDLWAFNEEVVARAIFESNIPIVSAVGHETDFSISDLVADHRSPTPSAAVEHVVPDKDELSNQIHYFQNRLNISIQNCITKQKEVVEAMELGLSPIRRKDAINDQYQLIDGFEVAFHRAISLKMDAENNRLQSLSTILNGLSPLGTLNRGYSISRTLSGEIITSSSQVKSRDQLNIKLSEGSLICTVDECLEE